MVRGRSGNRVLAGASPTKYPPLPGPLNPLPSGPWGFFAIWAEQLLANFFPNFSISKSNPLKVGFARKYFFPKNRFKKVTPPKKPKIPGGKSLPESRNRQKIFPGIFQSGKVTFRKGGFAEDGRFPCPRNAPLK